MIGNILIITILIIYSIGVFVKPQSLNNIAYNVIPFDILHDIQPQMTKVNNFNVEFYVKQDDKIVVIKKKAFLLFKDKDQLRELIIKRLED